MFTGEFQHNVDAKNRIFVPSKLREELGESFVVARDIREPILKIFSLSGWEDYIAPIKAQDRKIAEKALRYLHRNAVQLSADSQGRILLPKELLEYAGIRREAVIVGCYTYAEIWSAENYRLETENEDVELIRMELEKFGL